jgi:hypothetical protein
MLASIDSGNGIGEPRLQHNAAPPPMRIPLDEISFSTASAGAANDEEGSVVSSVSDFEDDVNDSAGAKVVDTVPRSIFSSYWKDDFRGTDPSMASCRRRALSPPSSDPQRVVLGSKVPQEQDPYQVYGIDRPHHGPSSERKAEEDSSLNTYERILQAYEQPQPCPPRASSSSLPRSPFESRPLWMSFFSGDKFYHSSEPQRLSELARGTSRATRSDTALIQMPKKSCLRRGRFSGLEGLKETTVDKSPASYKVCFQPKIEVRVFPPPVEQWSPSGWSSFFG